MKYMLLMYGTESRWTEEERKACMLESMEFCDQLAAQGKYLASSPLQPVTTAATVRVRDGQTLVTEGPFAETTEQLGGFYVLEFGDLDEAIAAFERAVEVQDGLPYMEPPFWYYPVRQSLGAALLQAGRPEEAERVFQESLIHAPNNGWALYGLMEAQKARGDEAGAAQTAALFDKAWAGDETTPDLSRL